MHELAAPSGAAVRALSGRLASSLLAMFACTIARAGWRPNRCHLCLAAGSANG
jgi:hypothetical protein